MQILWQVYEYIGCLCESLFAFLLYKRKIGTKRHLLALIMLPIIATGTFLMNRAGLAWWKVSLINLCVFLCYAVFLFHGNMTQRIILGVTPSIVFVTADHLVASLMMLFTS